MMLQLPLYEWFDLLRSDFKLSTKANELFALTMTQDFTKVSGHLTVPYARVEKSMHAYLLLVPAL